MTIGASVFLVALGAVLRYAITVDSTAIDLDVLGLILMIAGLAGLLLSLVLHVAPNKSDNASRRPVDHDPRL